MKKVGIPAVNARMAKIASEFGIDSEVYKKAVKYLKNELDDKNLRVNKQGILNIRQTKETKKGDIYIHPDDLDENIPKVDVLYENQREAFADSKSFSDQVMARYTNKDIKEVDWIREDYQKAINDVYEALNDFDGVKHQVYDVRDNTKKLDVAVYNGADYKGRAQELIDTIQYSAEWIRKARQLVNEYADDIAAQKAKYRMNHR